MNMIKKAQGATEYLIILAVVIIIALIVVGVMGGIPGIGGGGKNRANQAFWSTQDVAVVSGSVAATSATLKIRNNLRDTITIQSMTVGGNAIGEAPLTLTSGQESTVTATVANCASGSAYSHAISIGYDVSGGATNLTFAPGTNWEGTC